MIVITAKEIRLMLRARRAFGFMLACLLTIGGIFAVAWLAMSLSGEIDGSITGRTMLGRSFFMMISMAQLCAMGLIAPLMAATAVSGEREANTFDLLVSTGIPRLRLLLGKWFANVYYQVILLICLLPVLALVFQLGGVGLDEYLFAAVMIGMTVLTYGMIGLACSCVCRKSITALSAALMIVLFLGGGLPLLLVMLDEMNILNINISSNIDSLTNVLFWSVSPLMAWARHIDRIGRGSGGAALFSDGVFIGHMAAQAILFIGALVTARTAFDRIGREKAIPLADGKKRRGLFRRAAAGAAREVRDSENPLYARERNRLPWGRLLKRTAIIAIPVSLFFYDAVDERNSNNFVIITGLTSVCLMMLFIPIFAAPALTREREEKTFELLRVTPLASSAIVHAKFFSALRCALAIPAGLLLLPVLLRGLYVYDYSIPLHDLSSGYFFSSQFVVPAVRLAVLAVSFGALYTAMGIAISAYQHRSVNAITLAFLLMGLLTWAVPFLNLALAEATDRGALDFISVPLKFAGQYVMPLVSPAYYLIMGTEGGSERHVYTFRDLNNSVSSWEAWFWLALHTGLVLMLARLLLALAARRLHRERG